MKVFGLHGAVYRGARLAARLETTSSNHTLVHRRDILARWQTARRRGLSASEAAEAVGVARATLYRWLKRPEPRSRRPNRMRASSWRATSLVSEVETLRQHYPMWGKRKIAVLLRRQGRRVATSTVGRVLHHLMHHRRITPVPLLRRKPGPRRFRLIGPERHAKRLPKDLKPSEPGELVQVDTLFVNVAPDKPIKHFTAYDPVAKWTTALVAGRATARRAAALLHKLITACPFPVRGIQVDGGSEFMAEFEQFCAERQLTLFVLPPKSPTLNGSVERAQSTWRYEFYACHELPTGLAPLQAEVDRFADHFNHVRPHQALGDLTPAEYLAKRSKGDPSPSHMC